jgi:TRAP-type C4-dicarboxylate transport system permease small subunit
MNPVRNSGCCDSKPGGASNPSRIIPEPDPTAERGSISNGGNRWERIDEAIGRTEQTLLVAFLGFIILIAFLQIVLRNFLSTGLDWGDSLVRNLVLWIGFIGATLATKEGKHINIDVVSRWLPSFGKNMVALITHLFSFFVCGGLTYAALKFIKNEVQMGNRTFLELPAWVPELILPVTFILMTFRFGLRSFKNLSEIGKRNPLQDREEGI